MAEQPAVYLGLSCLQSWVHVTMGTTFQESWGTAWKSLEGFSPLHFGSTPKAPREKL